MRARPLSLLLGAAIVSIAAAVSSVALAGEAGSKTPTRIRGVVETLSGDTLIVKEADGTRAAISLPPHISVTALANRSLSNIKAGDYVGTAATPGDGGALVAEEVHIFPQSMRGAGEGHHPMDGPNRTMTNATVATVAADPKGDVLTLTYPGGSQTVAIGPKTRIVAIIPGDLSLLKPGAEVSVVVNPANGTPTARFIQAEKDGVPPL